MGEKKKKEFPIESKVASNSRESCGKFCMKLNQAAYYANEMKSTTISWVFQHINTIKSELGCV